MFKLLFGVFGILLGFFVSGLVYHLTRGWVIALLGGKVTWLVAFLYLFVCVVLFSTTGMLLGFLLGHKVDHLWADRRWKSLANEDQSES